MTDGPTTDTARSIIVERTEREFELALRLADQTSTRAQVVAGTLTLVITAASVVITAKSGDIPELQDSAIRGPALAGLFLLFMSLVLTLYVAVPKAVDLTHPDWVIAALGHAEVYEPLSDSDRALATSILQQLDSTQAKAYKVVLEANRLRGRILTLALSLMAVALLLGLYVATRAWITS